MENKAPGVLAVLETLSGKVLASCPLQPAKAMLEELGRSRRSVIESVHFRRRAGVTGHSAFEVSLELNGDPHHIGCCFSLPAAALPGNIFGDDQGQVLRAVQLALLFKSCGAADVIRPLLENEAVPDVACLAVALTLCKAVAHVESRSLHSVIAAHGCVAGTSPSPPGLPLPVMALFPREALYFVPNPAACRSLRACFELFNHIYWTVRSETGLEDLFVDGSFMSLNVLSTANTLALLAAHCKKLFSSHYGLFGVRGPCSGAALSTIDGDGAVEPRFAEMPLTAPASAKHPPAQPSPSGTSLLLRWDRCRSIAEIHEAAKAAAGLGQTVCVVGSGEHGGHGDESPVALPHVALGIQAKYIFVGPPCGSHHVAVYNELLRIEEDLVEANGFVSFV
jgi:hypothetical protein